MPPDRLQHPRDPHPRELRRQRRLQPRHRHKRHRRQVVDLIRPRRPQRVHQRTLIEQITLMQRDPITQMLDPLELLRRRTPHHPVHLITLLQQQLRQIRTVLTRHPGDQRALQIISPTYESVGPRPCGPDRMTNGRGGAICLGAECLRLEELLDLSLRSPDRDHARLIRDSIARARSGVQVPHRPRSSAATPRPAPEPGAPAPAAGERMLDAAALRGRRGSACSRLPPAGADRSSPTSRAGSGSGQRSSSDHCPQLALEPGSGTGRAAGLSATPRLRAGPPDARAQPRTAERENDRGSRPHSGTAGPALGRPDSRTGATQSAQSEMRNVHVNRRELQASARCEAQAAQPGTDQARTEALAGGGPADARRRWRASVAGGFAAAACAAAGVGDGRQRVGRRRRAGPHGGS